MMGHNWFYRSAAIGGQTVGGYIDALIGKYGGATLPFQETSGTTAAAINSALAVGRNILVDGDMETAGVAAWTALNNATLTKQGSAHGGAQCLRIARNGTNNPVAQQSILDIGATYRVIGYARSDGNALPRVTFVLTGTNEWTGTNSTSWQAFDFTATAVNANVQFVAVTSTGTEYVEFDDIVITRLNIAANSLTGANTGATVGQATGTKLGYSYLFDGVNDYVDWYSAALNSHWNPDSWAYGLFAKSSSWAAGTAYLGILRVDANNLIQLYRNGTNIVADFTAGGTSESVTIASGSPTGYFFVGLESDGTNMRAYYKGTQSGVDQLIAGTFVGNFTSTICTIGASSTTPANVLSGNITRPFLMRSYLSVAEWSKLWSLTGIA